MYSVKQAHIANVVYVNLLFEYDGESFSVQSDGEDGRRKGEFANDRRSLEGAVSFVASNQSGTAQTLVF
jgi:hypothetical protein